MKFSQFNFNDKILEAISYMGFEKATPVQEQAIPIILQGKDLIACAQTGTGKTAAFILPLLQKTEQSKKKGLKALIIVPTRELAMQIEQQFQGFSYFTAISSICIYGGQSGTDWDVEKKAITSGVDLIVATPGKMIAHLNMGYVNTQDLEFLILDEADKMMDMGFLPDIRKIISHLPKQRQTLMFSATMPSNIRNLAKEILQQPEEISLALAKPASGILQAAYQVEEHQKKALIDSLISDKPEYKSILIFTSTKKKVTEIVRALNKRSYRVEGISSDLDQKNRNEVLTSFRNKNIRVLVATDVLSRGIDVQDISLIINYDVPSDAEDYVHRVGRTARAESTGVAITLINRAENYKFNRIEKLIESKIIKLPVPENL